MPIFGMLSYIKTYWKIGVLIALLIFIGTLFYKIYEQKLTIAEKVLQISELSNDNFNLKNLNEKNQGVINAQKTSISKATELIDDLEQINYSNSKKTSGIIAQMKKEFLKCKGSTTIFTDANCSNIKIKQVGADDEIFNSISNIGKH